jgi:PKD repeat protein
VRSDLTEALSQRRHARQSTRNVLTLSFVTLVVLCTSSSALAASGDFTFSPQVPVIGAPVDFQATTSVTWDFGDDTSGSGVSVQHTYATRGTKTVTITLPDSSTVTHNVRVNAPPLAAFGWSPNVAQIDQPVSFDASASSDVEGIDHLLWDFGDGQQSNATSVQHAYASSGTRTVTVSVTDSDGVTTSVQHAVRVNAVPGAVFTFAALDRVAGQPFNVPLLGQRVAFSGTSSSDSDGTIAAYEWDFNGDGVFTDDNGPSLITHLTTPGIVIIGVRVTDSHVHAHVPVRRSARELSIDVLGSRRQSGHHVARMGSRRQRHIR